jgi:hypothetical protein
MSVESIAAWSCRALVLGPSPCKRARSRTRSTQYFHTAWRVQDAIFEAAPNAVTQTTHGYIWIGTRAGGIALETQLG